MSGNNKSGPITAIPMFPVKPEWLEKLYSIALAKVDIPQQAIDELLVHGELLYITRLDKNDNLIIELPHHADWRKTMTTARTLDLTCDCGQTNCCWPRYDNCGND